MYEAESLELIPSGITPSWHTVGFRERAGAVLLDSQFTLGRSMRSESPRFNSNEQVFPCPGPTLLPFELGKKIVRDLT